MNPTSALSAPSRPVPLIMPTAEDTLIPPHRAGHRDLWVDIGLTLPTYPPSPEIYQRLLDETQRLQVTGHAGLCLFIHKPPGLRWRIDAPDEAPLAELREAATAAAARIVGADRVRSAVYEPQQALFGGERSMRFVHRTWSADSLLWMRWHAQIPHPSPARRWDLSFKVLAHVFTQLGVVGWEDREVWDCVSEDTGRRLAEHEWTRPEVAALAGSLRSHWDTIWRAAAHQHRTAGTAVPDDALREFVHHTGPVLADWHAQCLTNPVARHPLTPRRAAAYWTVFHWNRAGLTSAQQALAAQTLAGRAMSPPTG
ncbi:lantibiotic dehydratase C-terminal domain-containing protein [Streptomyces sp. NPDC058690]|uniref:lantibiotic dehydratase C-terminal domain-containing protein n=1 Tax=Streptomyces sp. NPDC058690 TaxID=3346600 RepID=UPI003665DAE9